MHVAWQQISARRNRFAAQSDHPCSLSAPRLAVDKIIIVESISAVGALPPSCLTRQIWHTSWTEKSRLHASTLNLVIFGPVVLRGKKSRAKLVTHDGDMAAA